MPLLPNGERAYVDLRKLTDYALDPHHRVGGNKARVFASVLGLTRDDATVLQAALLSVAATEVAVLTALDEHGEHFAIEFMMAHKGRQSVLRSKWMIRHGEDIPRLVSVWVR